MIDASQTSLEVLPPFACIIARQPLAPTVWRRFKSALPLVRSQQEALAALPHLPPVHRARLHIALLALHPCTSPC